MALPCCLACDQKRNVLKTTHIRSVDLDERYVAAGHIINQSSFSVQKDLGFIPD